MDSLTAFFDGECLKPRHASGGPGRAAWLLGEQSSIVELGETTAPQAELAGLLALLEAIGELDPAKLFICGDHAAVVNQAAGRWAVNAEHLQAPIERARGLVAALEGRGFEVNLVLISRGENRAHCLLHPPKRPRRAKEN